MSRILCLDFTFRIRGRRYRGAIPEARTKWDVEQAESRIRQEVFEGRFGKTDVGASKVCDFIDRVYLPWAKANKCSWKDDEYKLPVLKSFFQRTLLRDVTGSRLTDVKRAFRGVCLAAGIDGLVWHDLRATFGTRLGEAGFDAFTIAAFLGHSNVRTTQRYVRATEREAVQAAMLVSSGHNLATRVNAMTHNQAVA